MSNINVKNDVFVCPIVIMCEFIIADAPLRLIVMKNGTRDQTKAVTVVAPDLGNVKKIIIFLRDFLKIV